jgi:hypothetical protein
MESWAQWNTVWEQKDVVEDCSNAWKNAGGGVEVALVTRFLSFSVFIMHNNKL